MLSTTDIVFKSEDMMLPYFTSRAELLQFKYRESVE